MKVAPLYESRLRLGDCDYQITIERMPRKTLTMHVSQQQLYVKAPLDANLPTVLHWVATKKTWIEKRMALLNRMVLDKNEVWYLGKKVTVEPADYTKIDPQGIRLKRGASFDAAMRRHAIDHIIDCFYAASRELGYGPKELNFRTMTRSWGRCSSKGEITLNTRLIACDPQFIRYVCIHEMAHLKYLNHSPAFWNEVKLHVSNLAAVKKLSIVLKKQDLLVL